MSDAKITEERVRAEHLKEVSEAAHWSYLVLVIGISFVLMIALMALLQR